MVMGRPTDYRPEYCQTVIEMGDEGCSVVEMAARIGVARSTLEYEWPRKHNDFSAALTRARELSQAWWERTGRENMLTQGFNGSVWSRSMAARFPKDWTEKKQTELTGSLQVENRQVIDPALLTHEQMEVIKQIGRQALLPPPVEGEWDEVGEGD